jgi:signal transduction histidine kinase
MNRLTQQDRYEKSLNFFGTITRSLSHELNNVVAIIKELNGLLGDFLYAAEQGRPLDPVRVKSTQERIGNQVERGKDYVKQLNSFAHTVDYPRTNMDAGELLIQITDICQRFATLKKVTLECRVEDQGVQLEGSPFDLLQIIYRCIDAALGASNAGAAIVIVLKKAEGGVGFTLTSNDIGDLGEEHAARLALAAGLVEKSGGKLESVFESGKPLSFVAHLPSSLSPLSKTD